LVLEEVDPPVERDHDRRRRLLDRLAELENLFDLRVPSRRFWIWLTAVPRGPSAACPSGALMQVGEDRGPSGVEIAADLRTRRFAPDTQSVLHLQHPAVAE